VVALIVVFLVLTALTVDFFHHRHSIQLAGRKAPTIAIKAVHLPNLDEHVPHGTFVAPGHTWLAIEHGGNEVMVGADPIATRVLGEIDAVALKNAGDHVARGEVIATLRRADRSIELRSAVEGVIAAVNAKPDSDPDMLRRDPYGDGWLYRIEVQGLAAQLTEMHMGEDAAEFLARELGRLRDAVAKASGAHGVGATLADGGPIAQGAMVAVDDAGFAQIAREIFNPAR
jgi:glycine cleavage system H protein